jgi:hypothetical protein
VIPYDSHNREERALCSHLFRLLHESLATSPESSPLQHVLSLLQPRLSFTAAQPMLSAVGASIFAEVALIRDAYHHRKPNVFPFMDALVELVREQEQVPEARPYSALPDELRDPGRIHPKQIAQKGKDRGLLGLNDQRVYGAIQGMFNAKPDLAIVLPSCFILVEAKLTQTFDSAQMARSHRIAEVWSRLLFADLGYVAPPPYAVARLGGARGADLTWQEVHELATRTYSECDRTRIALDHAVALLARVTK